MSLRNRSLVEEVQNANFCVHNLSEVIYGKKHFTRRQLIANFVEKTPILNDRIPIAFANLNEHHEYVARKAIAMYENLQNFGSDLNDDEMYYYQSLVMGNNVHPFYIHDVVFIPSLKLYCNDEQKRIWLLRALKHEIIGTYAQTELGHGNNLRGLETTATFDAMRDAFIINSPTTTSIKWYIGNTALYANFAIVTANLILNNRNMGLHNFIVQLRNEVTHAPLNGITIGDIGPKFGMNSNDNGYIKFDTVLIPRQQMLMAFAKINPHGEFVKNSHEKINYMSMVRVRSIMIEQQAKLLAKACHISTRYSCIRKQGEIVQGAGEVKIIDHQLHQQRLVPQIVNAYVFWFAAKTVRRLYQNVEDDIADGKIDSLQCLHLISCGLKAVVVEEVCKGIELCRLCCGANGYSNFSGLPELCTTAVAAHTYEGDSNVLLLQLGRFLMKSAKAIMKNERINLPSWFEYLRNDTRIEWSSVHELFENSFEKASRIFEYNARFHTFRVYGRMENFHDTDASFDSVFYRSAVEISQTARLHTKKFLIENFMSQLKRIGCVRIIEMMSNIAKLFMLHEFSASLFFIESGTIRIDQLGLIRDAFYNLLKVLRQNALALTESFDLNDREINSIIASDHPNFYENLIEQLLNSTVNPNKVDSSLIEKFIKPFLRKRNEQM